MINHNSKLQTHRDGKRQRKKETNSISKLILFFGIISMERRGRRNRQKKFSNRDGDDYLTKKDISIDPISIYPEFTCQVWSIISHVALFWQNFLIEARTHLCIHWSLATSVQMKLSFSRFLSLMIFVVDKQNDDENFDHHCVGRILLLWFFRTDNYREWRSEHEWKYDIIDPRQYDDDV